MIMKLPIYYLIVYSVILALFFASILVNKKVGSNVRMKILYKIVNVILWATMYVVVLLFA
jgi:hypothetical protein